MPPKDVLELGQVIVKELSSEQRRDVPSRWMAHHLAELIQTAETAEGEAKHEAESLAIDLIQRLWTNRRALPTPADPLRGYSDAIEVLSSMLPGADPWSRFRQHGRKDELLSKMFSAMSHLVMSGLLLTRAQEVRRIENVEWDALSEEERFLAGVLDMWRRVAVAPAPEMASFEALLETLVGTDDTDEVRIELQSQRVGGHPEPDQHDEILSHIEKFQETLDKLVDSWRAAVNCDGNPNTSEDEW